MDASTKSQYIIFDLEWNYVTDEHKLSEIIDIGAAKVSMTDGGLLQVVDTFHSYVKPTFSPYIAKEIRRITQVTSELLAGESPFPEVLGRFLDWIGPDEYFLCSWGPDHYVLIENCHLHNLQVDWLKNFNDIQIEYMRGLQLPPGQQVGLMTALQTAQIPFVGQPHRAVDDAVNTAKLFIQVFDRLQLLRNTCQEEEMWNFGIRDKGYEERKASFDKEYVRLVKRLKNSRVAAQLKRRELAELCGMSKKSITNIEGFRRKASRAELQAINHILHTIDPKLAIRLPATFS